LFAALSEANKLYKTLCELCVSAVNYNDFCVFRVEVPEAVRPNFSRVC